MTKTRVALTVCLGLVLLGLAAVGCSGSGASDDAAEPAPAEAPARGESAALESADEAVVVSNTGTNVPTVGPRVIQTAFLALAVPPGQFEEAVTRARNIASGLGGFVTSSTARQSDSELVRGTLVVRVPDRSYGDAMARITKLGVVEAREESGQDVSAEFVDLESRARHLEAVEAQLLSFLDKADEVSEALAVQSQLNSVQLELEQVRGRIRYLDDQTSFATISMQIREEVSGATEDDEDDGWGIFEAWGDGARGFVHVASAVFVGLATAAPVLLLIGVSLAVGVRVVLSYRRRTRSTEVPTASNPS